LKGPEPTSDFVGSNLLKESDRKRETGGQNLPLRFPYRTRGGGGNRLMAKKLTSAKAKKILKDRSVKGHPLTAKQKKFFGAIAGGAKPKRRVKKRRKY